MRRLTAVPREPGSRAKSRAIQQKLAAVEAQAAGERCLALLRASSDSESVSESCGHCRCMAWSRDRV